jgi:hypothetical protein
MVGPTSVATNGTREATTTSRFATIARMAQDRLGKAAAARPDYSESFQVPIDMMDKSSHLCFLMSTMPCCYSRNIPIRRPCSSIICRRKSCTRWLVYATPPPRRVWRCCQSAAFEQTRSEQQNDGEHREGIYCGDRVKVISDVVVYHVPKWKDQGIALKDKVGKVIGFCDMYRGEPITANYPIVVEFMTPDDGDQEEKGKGKGSKFTCHLAAEELERV